MNTTRHPVENVNWNDAARFCATLSQEEKLKAFYFLQGEKVVPLEGSGYRMPREAEWEYACRAGSATKFSRGDNSEPIDIPGWFSSNSESRTHAVGERDANPFGLYDMHGNVSEWVQDIWAPTYYQEFRGKPAVDPVGPFAARSQRVVRGGCWTAPESHGHSSIRLAHDPLYRLEYVGFRAALTVDAVRQALKVTGPAIPKSSPSAPSEISNPKSLLSG